MPLTIKNIFLKHIARLLFVAEEKTCLNSKILDQKYAEFKGLRRRRGFDKSVLDMSSLSNLIRFSRAAQNIQKNLCGVYSVRSKDSDSFRGDELFLTHEAIVSCMEDVVNNIELEIETRIVKNLKKIIFEFFFLIYLFG